METSISPEMCIRDRGNPRVYKALRDQLAAVLDELRRIEAGQGVNDELLDTIQMLSLIHI